MYIRYFMDGCDLDAISLEQDFQFYKKLYLYIIFRVKLGQPELRFASTASQTNVSTKVRMLPSDILKALRKAKKKQEFGSNKQTE